MGGAPSRLAPTRMTLAATHEPCSPNSQDYPSCLNKSSVTNGGGKGVRLICEKSTCLVSSALPRHLHLVAGPPAGLLVRAHVGELTRWLERLLRRRHRAQMALPLSDVSERGSGRTFVGCQILPPCHRCSRRALARGMSSAADALTHAAAEGRHGVWWVIWRRLCYRRRFCYWSTHLLTRIASHEVALLLGLGHPRLRDGALAHRTAPRATHPHLAARLQDLRL